MLSLSGGLLVMNFFFRICGILLSLPLAVQLFYIIYDLVTYQGILLSDILIMKFYTLVGVKVLHQYLYGILDTPTRGQVVQLYSFFHDCT
jgi:hypothetical protein